MLNPELEILFSLIEKGHYQAAADILPIVRKELEEWEEVTGVLDEDSASCDGKGSQPDPLATDE